MIFLRLLCRTSESEATKMTEFYTPSIQETHSKENLSTAYDEWTPNRDENPWRIVNERSPSSCYSMNAANTIKTIKFSLSLTKTLLDSFFASHFLSSVFYSALLPLVLFTRQFGLRSLSVSSKFCLAEASYKEVLQRSSTKPTLKPDLLPHTSSVVNY